MACSQAFKVVDDVDDVVAADNILSLSQGQFQPLNDNETQYSGHINANVIVGEAIETLLRFGTHQLQTEFVEQLPIDYVGPNMVEGPQVQQSVEELLTLPSQVPQHEWLEEAMVNMKKHIVTNTNEENLGMPSLAAYMNK